MFGAAGAIERAQSLRHDAFAAERAGVTENRYAVVMLKMLVEAHARLSAA
jgi:hypothetical protein